jgi:hypothetical protein
MLSITELRTVSKDADGNPQLGVFARTDIPKGTVVWTESDKNRTNRAYFSKEWIANATAVQIKKLDVS